MSQRESIGKSPRHRRGSLARAQESTINNGCKGAKLNVSRAIKGSSSPSSVQMSESYSAGCCCCICVFSTVLYTCITRCNTQEHKYIWKAKTLTCGSDLPPAGASSSRSETACNETAQNAGRYNIIKLTWVEINCANPILLYTGYSVHRLRPSRENITKSEITL